MCHQFKQCAQINENHKLKIKLNENKNRIKPI